MKTIPHNSGPGLVIGIPTLGRPVNLEWAMALKSLNPPINYNSVFQILKGQPVDVARNTIARYALDSGAKYLFFLGDDVIVPSYTLRQLIFRMEQDPRLGVCGGVYCAKCNPPAPLVFRGNGKGSYWDWKIGEYFEVTGLGMDCTLIRTDVFRDLPEPWFKTVESDQFLDGINNAESWTEDLWFFDKLAKQGKWKTYCDSFVMCDHLDIYADKVYKLPHDSLPMRRKICGRSKKLLVLGDVNKINFPPDINEFDMTIASDNEDNISDYRVSYGALPFDSNVFDKVIYSAKTAIDKVEIQRVLKVA